MYQVSAQVVTAMFGICLIRECLASWNEPSKLSSPSHLLSLLPSSSSSSSSSSLHSPSHVSIDESSGATYSKCNTTVESETEEVSESGFYVTSPNYPNFYPRNSNCYFHVKYPKGYRILVVFTDLDIEKSSKSKDDCDLDYVSLYPISSLNKLVRLCGKLHLTASMSASTTTNAYKSTQQSNISSSNHIKSNSQLNPNYVITSGNLLTVRFYSESNAISRRGFKFQIIPFILCTNVTLVAQSNSSGEYCSLPFFPFAYLRESSQISQICTVQLNTTDVRQSLRIRFTHFVLSENHFQVGQESCKAQSQLEIRGHNQGLTLCGDGSKEDETSGQPVSFTLSNGGSPIDIYVRINANSLTQISWKPGRKSNFGFCFHYESLQLTTQRPSGALINNGGGAIISGSGVENCESDRNGWFSVNRRCFKVHFEYQLTWKEAKDYCETHYIGGKLASITSPIIQTLIEKIIISQKEKDRKLGLFGPGNGARDDQSKENRYPAFWIGANDVKHENSFRWDDGQTFSYTNWFRGWPHPGIPYNVKYGMQPSDDGFSDQDCVEIRNHFRYATKGVGTTGDKYFWNDISCNTTNRFICQIPNPAFVDNTSTDAKGKMEPEEYCKSERIHLTSYHPWAVLTSPLYPGPYPNNLNCSTLVTTTVEDALIEMVFTDFILEDGGPSCKYDFLEINITTASEESIPKNDANDEQRPQIYSNTLNQANQSKTVKYCSDWNSKIKFLRVIAQEIQLRLVTDDSHAYRGFRIVFRTFPKKQLIHEQQGKGYLCDSKRFIYFRSTCYLVSSFPEVSWYTATQICKDIEAQMVSIETTQSEEKLKSLLNVHNFEGSTSDSARLMRYFWLSGKPPEYFVDKVIADGQTGGPSEAWAEQEWSSYEYEIGPKSKTKNNNNRGRRKKSKTGLRLSSGTTKAEGRKMTTGEDEGQETGEESNPDQEKDEPNLDGFETQDGQHCTVASVDKADGRRLMYNQLECSHQAGYICVKKPLDLSKAQNKTIENDLSGTISSPNYPGSYVNNLDYGVHIASNDSNSVILVYFDLVDIEKQDDCLYDYLMLKEPFSVERICGQVDTAENLSRITYVSSGSQLSILFHSDFSNRGLGFVAHWQIVPLNWCTQSERSYTGQENGSTLITIDGNGTIESPGYPDWSLPSLDCSLTLMAPKNQKILLTVIDFDVGEMRKSVRATKCETATIVTSSSSSSSSSGPSSIMDQDYLVIVLDEDKRVTLCGSIQSNNLLQGEQFMSYGTRLTFYYRTKTRRFRSPFTKRKGFKFKYQLVSKEDSITSVLSLKEDSFGIMTSMNYPFGPPFKSTHNIYLRTEVGHYFELKASKQTISSIEEGFCSEDENTDISPIKIVITDSFGNTSLQPPTPNIWSLCRQTVVPTLPLASPSAITAPKESSSSASFRQKIIKSVFHTLLISTSIAEKRHGKRSLNSPTRSTFHFHFKVKKDPTLKNRTLYLAKEYPVDSCIYSPCSEHGLCVHRKLRQDMVDICDCDPHWTGLFCHLTLCDLKPCGDFGVCKLAPNEDRYVCHCNPGFTGQTCADTVAVCDRTNPCGDRGKCSLINGTPKCSCYPWYEGKYCERLRIRIQYKPLSQRMLEEPFWLGLITVAVVLALISLVYCLKKKFAERIEKFFAEEIERSKTQYPGSGPRYSLTSNAGISLNVTPMNTSPPMTRSRSSIIGRLCKHGRRSSSNPGHLSDSEVSAHRKDGLSDDESTMVRSHSRRFPSLMFFSQKSMLSSSFNINSSSERDEKSKILASLVGNSGEANKEKDRRMSLDDFFRMTEAKILKKRMASNRSQGTFSDTEGNSPNSFERETSFTFYRDARTGPPSIAEFHVITENSHEEDESMGSNNGSLTIDSLPNLLKQESEAETLLSNIQHIQKVSRSGLSLNELDESSSQSQCRPRLVRSVSPRRPPSGFSSSSKTSSCSSSEDVSPNHCPLPEITITQATVEPQYEESFLVTTEDINQGNEESESPERIESRSASPSLSPSPPNSTSEQPDQQQSHSSLTPQVLSLPSEPYPVRRLSAPNPTVVQDLKARSGSPSSQSCGTPVFTKSNDLHLPTRKYSLELSVPKITINSNLQVGYHRDKDGNYDSPPQSAREIKASFSHLTIINSSSDRTISESNLSTSGYSSFSSPGISRCSSSSPIPDEMGILTNLQTLTIPEAPDESVSKETLCESKGAKHKSTYGNFLTIPVIAYPVHHHHRSASPKRTKSTKEEARGQERSCAASHVPTSLHQEDIELQALKPMQKRASFSVNTKRDRLLAMRQQYKTIAPTGIQETGHYDKVPVRIFTPSKSMDSYPIQYESTSFQASLPQSSGVTLKKSPSSERARIQRNPSWPGYLKNSSDSEGEGNDNSSSTRCPTRVSNSRRPPKRTISKSYSISSPYNEEPPSVTILTPKSSVRKSRHKYRNIDDLLRYDSIDRGSSSPKTSSSKDLEKYSSSDSLLSFSGDNLITFRSSTSLNRLCTTEKPLKHVRRNRKFRRANSELVYFDETKNSDVRAHFEMEAQKLKDHQQHQQLHRHSNQSPHHHHQSPKHYSENERSFSLSQSYPALLMEQNERYVPQPRQVCSKLSKRKPKASCYSIPVSPSVDYGYTFGAELISPDCIAVKLGKEKSRSNISFDCLSDTVDRYSLKAATPEDDTTSDEAGSERTVLLRKNMDRS